MSIPVAAPAVTIANPFSGGMRDDYFRTFFSGSNVTDFSHLEWKLTEISQYF